MTTKDLGYVLWRTPATVTYQFTNTGDKPLVISNVTTSCGCAKAQWTEEPVPAGGKGKITVVFDAEAIGHLWVCIAMQPLCPFIWTLMER